MTTISERLQHWASVQPEKPFCEFIAGPVTETISFAELYRRSSAYARRYAELQIRPGDVVVIILNHTPHLFYSYLGAILAGAIPTFMPFPSSKQRPDFYWKDHQTLFERIRPALLVTYEENASAALAVIPDFDVPMLIAGGAVLGTRENGHATRAPHGADDIACLQHSSGTTSLKKGVMLTHRAVIDEVEAYAQILEFGAADSIASWLPLYHDMGFIACFMASVVLGTRLVMLDPFEWVIRPHLLLDAIERFGTTFCWLPNFAFAHIVKATRPGREWNLRSVRAFINCSEPCKADTFDRFYKRFAGSGVTAEVLQVCYAMAENVFAVTQTIPGREIRSVAIDAAKFALGTVEISSQPGAVRIVSCGLPIDGVNVCIRDAGGLDVGECIVGEIHVRSRFLFSGYYGLPQLTAQRIRNGWYATGDMGFLLDGELYVTGRADDMLIVNGRNYYAHEIEAIANTVDGIIAGRNVAIGLDDADTGALQVVVLAECGAEVAVEEMAHMVRRRVLERLGLAVHDVVAVAPGSLIKTTSGKLSRSKNKQLYLDGAR